MHIWLLVIVSFWFAQPAVDGKPAQPESAHAAVAILFSQAECIELGQETVSMVEQSKGVSHAAYACLPTENPNDKAA